MNIKDYFDSFATSALDRFRDPLIGTFFLAVFSLNWKIFFYAGSKLPVDEKITAIQTEIVAFGWKGLGCALLIAVVYVFVFKSLSVFAKELWMKKVDKELLKISLDEHKEELLNENIALKEKVSDLLNDSQKYLKIKSQISQVNSMAVVDLAKIDEIVHKIGTGGLPPITGHGQELIQHSHRIVQVYRELGNFTENEFSKIQRS